MTRRRRCRACHALFTPDPRVGARQHTCGAATCQVERHRQECKAWRERERSAVEEGRLRRRLGAPGEVRLDVVREQCGSKTKVVIEECLRLFSLASREQFKTKNVEQRKDLLRLVDRPRKEQTTPPPAPP
jgi:hypothetical protein